MSSCGWFVFKNYFPSRIIAFALKQEVSRLFCSFQSVDCNKVQTANATGEQFARRNCKTNEMLMG